MKNKIKKWVGSVNIDENAMEQIKNTASIPFLYKWISVMPDAHYGMGSTIGTVLPTKKAIIPAAVGVDIGCGMMAVRTSLEDKDLPDNLFNLRILIESNVPHGRTSSISNHDKGSWKNVPKNVADRWSLLENGFNRIIDIESSLERTNNIKHLGTLGGGNHFIEICLDESKKVWVMLHSGSRGIGNAIGRHFIDLAKKDMMKNNITLPDIDLSYLKEGSENFENYVYAVEWAQGFARYNRDIMMENTILALREIINKPFHAHKEAIDCHHNYISYENHYNEDVWVTRKGALRAEKGKMGIIPGSMGTKSYIVEGLGNKESFCSCSHGAGRIMSRKEAKIKVSLEEHNKSLSSVECKKDKSTLDETPSAYKDIDAVMEAQKDLVKIKHCLKQVLCVKG